MTTELSKPNRRNWMISNRDQKNIYSLALILHGTTSLELRTKLANLVEDTEFKFPVNPKSMELEEPAAVVIKPTQGGGQFIEHQGQIYKNITISGTTGLRPNPAFGSSKNAFSANGLPNEFERTGFDDLISLRNLFRAYYIAKVTPELANFVVMLWKNGKEGEYYIVEPITFRTSRDSSSPLTASYNITLRTIKRYEKEARALVKDPLLNRKSLSNRRSIINRAIQGLADSINSLNVYLDSALSSYARTITDILAPTNELFSAISALATTSKRTLEIPRHALSTLSSNISGAIRDMSELVYIGTGISNRPSNEAAGGVYWPVMSELVGTLRNLRRTVTAIEATPWLFSSSSSEILNSKKAQFIDSVFGNTSSGGESLDLSNEAYGSSVGQAIVGANDNIRKLAKRLLGSTGRWKALVIANGLKAPYISSDGDGINVLRPGDYIMYPLSGSDSATAVASENVGKYRTISPVEERLGRDILLASPTSAGGITQFDLVVGDNGDIALVEGVANMEQAIRIKFETEQGELALHPYFGIKYPLGVKAPGVTGFIDFDVNARSTLLSDPRVSDIGKLDITFSGNTITTKGEVHIKGFDSNLSFDFSTRR